VAALAVFSAVKGNCTFSRCAGLNEFRKAVVAATTAFVAPSVVVCGVALEASAAHNTAKVKAESVILFIPSGR
jgi:hypothetical protein